MTDARQPTERDRENVRIRQEIAQRQAEEYDRVLAWAEEAFGPGWRPSHRHCLVEIDEEERVRYTPERSKAAATVYTVKNIAGKQRHFTVSEDGKVTECESYQAGFGPMLWEPHSSKGFEQSGTFCHYYRYSLCWAPYERYQPKSAEQLVALRASRQRKKTEREDKKWAADHPLLAWAEAVQREEAEEQRGRSV
ncbi:MAG TPA: hypothetical protein VN688_08740 [Gemmataceae bacterium]|nr:hypothetical protein [Gemmataceae bacterium]